MSRSLARLAARARSSCASSSVARRAYTAMLLFAAVASCRDGGTGPLADRSVALALQPSYAVAATDALPVNLIRLVATQADGGRELGRTEVTVDPAAAEWPLSLDVRIPGGTSVNVNVTVELINVGPADATSVEWSGRAGPILVRANTDVEVASVVLGRGPLENLLVTSIDILPIGGLVEGDEVQPEAVVIGATNAKVFWSSLDPAVGTVDAAGVVKTLRDGTLRIVAAAGVKADTIPLVVSPVPSSLAFSTDSVRLDALGAEDLVIVQVLDPRGAVVPGAEVAWSVANAGVAEHLGGGRFRAVANGVTAITASVVGRPSVAKTTGLRVTQQVARVSVSPHEVTLAGVGATTTLLADAADVRGNPMSATFAWSSSNEAVATVDGAGKVTAVNRGTAWVRVASAGKSDSAAVTVSAGVPATLTKLAGDGQSARVATTVAVAPAVKVLDASGAPVAGAAVTFSVPTGSGNLIGEAVVLADANGVATVGGWTLGPATGTQVLNASIVGANLVATFTATATPGNAVALKGVSGANQNGTSGTPLAAPLVVRAVDGFGNGVPGVAITWRTSHDGTMTPATSQTDATGATQTSFTPGFGATSQFVNATSPGVDSTQAFFGVNVTIPPPSVALRLADVDKVSVGHTATVEVKLTRPAPVGGVRVTVTSDNGNVLVVGNDGVVDLAEGQSVGTIPVTGVAAGAATLKGNATGYLEGSASVLVALRAISMPAALNVPFGQTASLPVTLTDAAPPGGLTVTLASSDPTKVELQAATVFIAAGATSGNATVFGRNPGPAQLVATATNFDDDTTNATTTASLNVGTPASPTTTSVSLNQSFGADVLVRFESNGQPVPAPAPGVTVSLAAVDPGCVAVPATATIPTGLVNVTVRLTYGGSTATTCSTRVRATAANIQPDSITASVAGVPPISMTATATIGRGLMESYGLGLGASNHGGVTVRVASNDPGQVLVAPNATTAGAAFIDVPVVNGSSSFSYYVQVLDTANAGASVTASAPGFTGGTQRVTIAAPGIEFINLAKSTTTANPDNAFYVRTGVPFMNAQGQPVALNFVQPVRFGGSAVPVTVSSSNTGAGTLVTQALPGGSSQVTVTIPPGLSNSPTNVATGGMAFRPVGGGQTIVQASASGFLQTDGARDTVTVTSPAITLGNTTVGGGLQTAVNVSLSANAAGTTVTIASGNSQVLLVSPNATTAGGPSITVTMAPNVTSATYYVQGVEGATGAATVTATATGYTSGAMTATVVQPGVEIINLAASHTALEANVNFYARVGVPFSNAQGVPIGLNDVQAVRAGAPGALTVTFTSSDPAVARLVTSGTSGATVSAQIAVGQSNTPTSVTTGGVQYDALAAGTTAVSATIPGYVATTGATVSTTVGGTPITASSNFTLGAGLQQSASFSLGAPASAGLVVRVQSADPAKLLVSPNATTAGTAFVDITMSSGSSSAGFYVHGVEGSTGAVTFTVSAPGYSSTTSTVNLVTPALELINLNTTTTSFAPDNAFYVRVGTPTTGAAPASLSDVQSVRAGAAALTATVTSGTPSVGTLWNGTGELGTVTVTIPAGSSNSPPSVTASGGVAFRAKTTGTTLVSASIPGYTTTLAGQRTVTVGTPAITMTNGVVVGAGLQTPMSFSFGNASQHGGVTVTLRSSNSQVLLVSQGSTFAGQPSITVTVPNGQTSFQFYVAGVNGSTGTPTITASAQGFTDGTQSVGVVAPAIEIIGLPTTAKVGTDDAFQVRVGTPGANQDFLNIPQEVRVGGGAVTATLASGTPGVGVLKTTQLPNGAASATVTIPERSNGSPATVAGGGVAFSPVAAGSTKVTVSATGFTPMVNPTTQTGTGVVNVTVSP
ncbi:MAG: beta strand repeat-containing protein [Gemmatimonadaceae bacterium]